MKDKQFPSPFDARERLVDRIGSDFYDLHQQLTAGLQMVLELHDVSPAARRAVGEYIGDVARGLAKMEAGVVKLAEAGYGVADPVSGIDPKEHGHTTLSALFDEIRRDEAMKREQSPASGKEGLRKILGGKAEVPAPEPARGNDLGMER